MAHRGRCRCGTVLQFRRGPSGYKTRCPACGSVVRLRVGNPRREPTGRAMACTCGAVVSFANGTTATCPECRRTLSLPGTTMRSPLEQVLLRASAPTESLDALEASDLGIPRKNGDPVGSEVVSAAASALPSRILSSTDRGRPAPQPGCCASCGAPTGSGQRFCATCRSRDSLMASIESEAENLEARVPRPPKRKKMDPLYGWLAVVGALVTLSVGVLIWSLWH